MLDGEEEKKKEQRNMERGNILVLLGKDANFNAKIKEKEHKYES